MNKDKKNNQKPEETGELKDGQTEPSAEEESKDYDALWDKHLRLQAEFDNYRKRAYKERAEFVKFANEGLILELLEILDNFERGVKSAELKKDFDLLHQGVDMISKQLHSLLETKGLCKIVSLGQKFDPHVHEAVEVIEKEGLEEDIVAEEMQPGYTLNNRIIRPARVKVHKSKHKKEESGGQGEIRDTEIKNEDENKKDIIDKEG